MCEDSRKEAPVWHTCRLSYRQLVVEKSHMSAELFNLYLHQNYIDFFADMEDVARASEYLSDADFLTTDWTVSYIL